ncbi:MAG: hypothetical protein WA139_04070 [Candidatus Aenigmatarchaeota archaeon]
MSSKGVIPAFVAYGAAFVLIVAAMLLIFVFSFKNNMEITISDKIADGISSINYFYLTEKNINEFAQIVTEITAKESGEACGGVDCYAWTAGYPSYNDLRGKFEEALRGKITGFPAQIGNGGRISFAPPRISGLEMDENQVKISMFPQQVYRKTDSFLVNSSSEIVLETEKQTRYLLLARIGQRLYGNGTYVRDWGKVYVNSGKFDCGGIAKSVASRTRLSSRADLAGCKILDINFDVDDSSWNSYKNNCYNIANSADPGEFAGKVEGGKVYVQIDSLLEKSLICGISGATDETDGLASVSGSYGEVSKSSESVQPVCTEEEAGADAWQKAKMEEKIQPILDALSSSVEAEAIGIDVQSSAKIGTENSYTPAGSQSGWSESCGSMYYDTCGGCPSNALYCKSGDVCGLQASFNCYGCGSCQRRVDGKKTTLTSYCLKDAVSGYCCPAEYPVFDSYTKKCFSSSEETLKIEKINKVPPPGSQSACGCAYGLVTPPWYAICPINYPDCISKPSPDSGGNCGWSYSNGRTRDDYSYSCEYRGGANEGSATISASYSVSRSSDTTTTDYSVFDSWGNSKSYEEGISIYTSGSGSNKYNYWCKLGAYFKFIFTPDITFKIIDTAGDKIVEKGTTNFENLYFAVKFKPAAPYVIGDPDFVPPTEYTCTKTSGQTCEAGAACSSGKTSGSGTCESGKVCCKPASNGESKIVITGEGKDITI